MKMKHAGLWLMMIVLLGLSGCFGGKDDYSKQVVCIYDGASIRAEANKNGKWLSSLALGETAIFEGKPVADPADPKTEYIKVKLSDGTKGYVSTWTVVQGAYVGVIQEQVKIYKRPDLLSESGKTFEIMDIVAVEEESEDWVRVTGEGKAKTGWLEKGMIRKDKEDVVTAVVLRKAIKGKEKTVTQEEVEQIIATLSNPNNYFAIKMLEKYETVDVADESFEEESVDAEETIDSQVTDDVIEVSDEENSEGE